MLSPYQISFKDRHRERGGDMVLGKPVTAPFPHAPEGMAAGRLAASAAPSEARAPGSLPAPRHPDTVRVSLPSVGSPASPRLHPRPGLPDGDGAPPGNRAARRPRGVASFRPDARRPMFAGRRDSFSRGGVPLNPGDDRRDWAPINPPVRPRRRGSHHGDHGGHGEGTATECPVGALTRARFAKSHDGDHEEHREGQGEEVMG